MRSSYQLSTRPDLVNFHDTSKQKCSAPLKLGTTSNHPHSLSPTLLYFNFIYIHTHNINSLPIIAPPTQVYPSYNCFSFQVKPRDLVYSLLMFFLSPSAFDCHDCFSFISHSFISSIIPTPSFSFFVCI